MKKVLGIVNEIYLPSEKINGKEVLDIYKSKIGFKINVNGRIIKFEQTQNNENVKIYCGDKVYLFFDLNVSKYPIDIKVVK